MTGQFSKEKDPDTVIWYGRPSALALAREIFLLELVVFYFSIIAIWTLVTPINEPMSGTDIPYVAALAVLCLLACALLLIVAYVIAQHCSYVLTKTHLIVRTGIFQPVTMSIPVDQISEVSRCSQAIKTASIFLKIKVPAELSAWQLWPSSTLGRRSKELIVLRCMSSPEVIIAHLRSLGVREIKRKTNIIHRPEIMPTERQ